MKGESLIYLALVAYKGALSVRVIAVNIAPFVLIVVSAIASATLIALIFREVKADLMSRGKRIINTREDILLIFISVGDRAFGGFKLVFFGGI